MTTIDLTQGKNIEVGRKVLYRSQLNSVIIHTNSSLYLGVKSGLIRYFPDYSQRFIKEWSKPKGERGSNTNMGDTRVLTVTDHKEWQLGLMLGGTVKQIGYIDPGSYDEPAHFNPEGYYKVSMVQPLDGSERFHRPILVAEWNYQR